MRFICALCLFAAACDGAEEDESLKDTGPEGTSAEDTGPEDTGPEDTGTDLAPLAIAGDYVDIYGTLHTIEDTRWEQEYPGYAPSIFAIESYDNAAQLVIAQNDALNGYFPELWSRFDWVEHEGHLYYCQTAYGAATEQEALSTPRADDSDPSASGCGGFSWTDLSP